MKSDNPHKFSALGDHTGRSYPLPTLALADSPGRDGAGMIIEATAEIEVIAEEIIVIETTTTVEPLPSRDRDRDNSTRSRLGSQSLDDRRFFRSRRDS
jgi:hypothetical protein